MTTRSSRPFRIGVLGASGGLGASTFATTLARTSARAGRPTLLVDLRPFGGGIDVVAGLEEQPGRRWPRRLRHGQGPGLDALVTEGSLRVLSHERRATRGLALGVAAQELVGRLSAQVRTTVLDLPGPEHPTAPVWWRSCDHLVLLCGAAPAQVAAAMVLAPACPAPLGVVVRDEHGGAPARTVAAALGMPLLGSVGTSSEPAAAWEETAGLVLATAVTLARLEEGAA